MDTFENDSNWVKDGINSFVYVLILEIIIEKPSYGYLIKNHIENRITKVFPDYQLFQLLNVQRVVILKKKQEDVMK